MEQWTIPIRNLNQDGLFVYTEKMRKIFSDENTEFSGFTARTPDVIDFIHYKLFIKQKNLIVGIIQPIYQTELMVTITYQSLRLNIA